VAVHFFTTIFHHRLLSDGCAGMGCQSLEHLNLTSTEVTDEAIGTILKLKKLKSLCLGSVNITPDAVETLKELKKVMHECTNAVVGLLTLSVSSVALHNTHGREYD
jgi:hypothetical protein